jgi:hypothetical protein
MGRKFPLVKVGCLRFTSISGEHGNEASGSIKRRISSLAE